MENLDKILGGVKIAIANGNSQELESLVYAEFAEKVKSHLMQEMKILEHEFLYGRGSDTSMVGVMTKGIKL